MTPVEPGTPATPATPGTPLARVVLASRGDADRVCVIGAGSSGLAAARHLMAAGFDVTVLERSDDLGGNWNYDKGTARVYRSTHTISSKPGTEYPDFPMPASFPDYPHHAQVCAYLRDYARHFGVDRRIRYGTEVTRVERDGDGVTPHWWVTTAGGQRERFGALVIANGHNWSPKYPEYPGSFTGDVTHSAFYRTPDTFEGKRVLVVGAGNSGCDIIVEASLHATKAYHSTRRGYHYVPKYLWGRPADVVGDQMLALRLPTFLRRAIAELTMRLLVGDPQSFGLPRPDHRLFETHPIVNTLLPYYVRQGDIVPKPDVARLDGRTVHFADGSHAEVDLIVYATGYRIEFPFIDPALLNWHDGRPRLWKNVFHPECDTLFVAGLIQPDSGQFGLVHWQARTLALFLRAVREGAPAAEWLRNERRAAGESLGNGIKYKESTRHHVEIEHWSYRRGLERVAGRLERGLGTAGWPGATAAAT